MTGRQSSIQTQSTRDAAKTESLGPLGLPSTIFTFQDPRSELGQSPTNCRPIAAPVNIGRLPAAPAPAGRTGADFVILISSDFCTEQSVRYLHKFRVRRGSPARPARPDSAEYGHREPGPGARGTRPLLRTAPVSSFSHKPGKPRKG